MGQRIFKPNHRRSAGREFRHNQDHKNLYNHEWEKYRLKFLRINCECYACGSAATVVDHLIPHQKDIVLFKKTDNHIPLCASCHNKITALFDRRYRAGNPITKKLEWLSFQRGQRGLSRRVKVMPSYP